jgi:hypothetical protein
MSQPAVQKCCNQLVIILPHLDLKSHLRMLSAESSFETLALACNKVDGVTGSIIRVVAKVAVRASTPADLLHSEDRVPLLSSLPSG